MSASGSRTNVTLSSQKSLKKKKWNKKKTKKNIKKLFEILRRDSQNSLSNISNETVVSLDDSAECHTLINASSEPNQAQKRKNSNETELNEQKRRKTDADLIIINDDSENDVVTNIQSCKFDTPTRNAPCIDCSTPVTQKDRQTLKDHITDNFSNNQEEVQEEIVNLTKDINRNSYLTIDLTSDSENRTNKTVINLEDSVDTQDCTVVSISNIDSSMSGDSDVTVINNNVGKKNNVAMRKIASGIAKMNASQKGKLLEYITEKIFNGCEVSPNVRTSISNTQNTTSRATETAEDTYIKQVILGESKSRNSIGSNIYHPAGRGSNRTGLRMVIIDGSNVAMEYGKGKCFSVKGLKICIEYFLKRGHVVKAFVPRFRCKFGKSTDGRLLDSFERQGLVVYTPSREIHGKMITSYDDRYIVQCAAEFDGVIVSGDNYRDLLQENPRWRFVIENRVLPFTWVDDMIMFPRDPLGRYGPSLEQFLKHS